MVFLYCNTVMKGQEERARSEESIQDEKSGRIQKEILEEKRTSSQLIRNTRSRVLAHYSGTGLVCYLKFGGRNISNLSSFSDVIVLGCVSSQKATPSSHRAGQTLARSNATIEII